MHPETALLLIIGLRFYNAHNKKTTKSLEVSDNHRIFAADKIVNETVYGGYKKEKCFGSMEKGTPA